MTRLVRGADGRMWTLRGRMEWTRPATVDDFERDVAAGVAPGIAMMTALGILVIALVVWTPAAVVVPSWLLLALAVVLLFFPVRWLLRRPWSLVANTPGNAEDLSPEHWAGTVRGMFTIRQAAAKIARDIEVYSRPPAEGPLHPVD